jgi:hypothetical protein
MEVNRTVEYGLDINDDELQEIAGFARDYMKRGLTRDKAISSAVDGYLQGQDDCIYYTITDEATKQIEVEVNKLLTK